MKLKTSFLPIFCVFLVTLDSVSAQTCFNGFFKLNSTYDSNRRRILSSLASNVTSHNGFFNSSIGQDPNRIFMIAMCIPGTIPEACSDSIKGASDRLLQSCPNQTEAYTWPECCMVRYSNVSFSGSLLMEPSLPLYNTGDIGDTGVNLTVFNRVYDELILRTIAGAFDNVTFPPPPPRALPQPPLPLTPPVSDRANKTGKDRKKIPTGIIVAIVVPAAVILALLVLKL